MKGELTKVIRFIQEYYHDHGLSGCVLGISGGKDSAVVAGLMCKALGSDNVIGLTLPCHSRKDDRVDAKKISDHYGFKLYNIDLTNVFDEMRREFLREIDFSFDDSKNSDINLKPRLRMASCYYMAVLLTEMTGLKYLVVGTSNKCEIYVGYLTKGGDTVCDIAPIANFSVSEVIELGRILDVPEEILKKAPSDGLSGMTDEDKLGIKYSDIEKYMRDGMTGDKDVDMKIIKMHDSSRHKFEIPTYKRDSK